MFLLYGNLLKRSYSNDKLLAIRFDWITSNFIVNSIITYYLIM